MTVRSPGSFFTPLPSRRRGLTKPKSKATPDTTPQSPPATPTPTQPVPSDPSLEIPPELVPKLARVAEVANMAEALFANADSNGEMLAELGCRCRSELLGGV